MPKKWNDLSVFGKILAVLLIVVIVCTAVALICKSNMVIDFLLISAGLSIIIVSIKEWKSHKITVIMNFLVALLMFGLVVYKRF